MMLQPLHILSLHAESSVQNIAVALVKTDGLDILEKPLSFKRPFPEELRQELWNCTPERKADTDYIQQLDQKMTDCFTQVLKEACTIWNTKKIDYIALSGHFIHLSSQDKTAIELGNLQQIANTFRKPVVGHFVQSDLNAGGMGSPLLSVFWQSITKNLPKPLGVVGLGGIIKLNYIGSNGELGACDLGVGLALLEKWINRHSPESQDEKGILAAKGQINSKVLKALLNHPYLSQPPPKAIHRNDFDSLLEQVEGLSLMDGCATITEFMVQMIIQATQFFNPSIKHWLFIGAGRKNPTLMLALERNLKNVYTPEQVLPFTNHLNAIGYGFLGARCITQLPISLPETTGANQPTTAGSIYLPE